MFVVPPASDKTDTVATHLNSRGDAVGGFNEHSIYTSTFIRDRDGNYTVFDAPYAYQTGAVAINDRGDVAGSMVTLSVTEPGCCGLTPGNGYGLGFVRYKARIAS